TELYHSGLWIAALRALADLGHITGHEGLTRDLQSTADRQLALLNQIFWNSDKQLFAFALDKGDRRIDIPSVLAAVPMWFGLLDAAKAEPMINALADSDFGTDWGARIISSRDPNYDPGGYHYGTVWPLFTGWAGVGE